ncbi:hypothetical protein PYK79_23180 [Streptomyces sp. ID05-04B]|uniref:hypothetical protein n=1 Tax=Streptomyces sp. ID05-04B TaxID=3028661 RepID=UPI0029C1B8A6|nr:hypothetical protein [Streptomyces sp. ID05-04B]MDX5565646.1 hypothetical protein [Streptomyces sp. ID05-04B]
MTLAQNPGPAPFAWETGGSILLRSMVLNEPVRRTSASERAAVLRRAAELQRDIAAMAADREAARTLQRGTKASAALRRGRRR